MYKMAGWGAGCLRLMGKVGWFWGKKTVLWHSCFSARLTFGKEADDVLTSLDDASTVCTPILKYAVDHTHIILHHVMVRVARWNLIVL